MQKSKEMMTDDSNQTFGESREQLHQNILQYVNQTMPHDQRLNSLQPSSGIESNLNSVLRDSFGNNRSKLSRHQGIRPVKDKKKKRSVANVQMIPQFASMVNGFAKIDDETQQNMVQASNVPSREKCQSAERHSGMSHHPKRKLQRRGVKRDSGAIHSSQTGILTADDSRRESSQQRESRPPTQLMIAQKYMTGIAASGKNNRKLNQNKQTIGQEITRVARQTHESRSLATNQLGNQSNLAPSIESHKINSIRQDTTAPPTNQMRITRYMPQNTGQKTNGALDYIQMQQSQSMWRQKQIKSPFLSNTPNSYSNKAMDAQVVATASASSSKAVTIAAAKNKVSLRDTLNQSAQIYGMQAGARTDNACSRLGEREINGRLGAMYGGQISNSIKASPQLSFQASMLRPPVSGSGMIVPPDNHMSIQQYSPQQQSIGPSSVKMDSVNRNNSNERMAAPGKAKISIKGYKRSFAHALGLTSVNEPAREQNQSNMDEAHAKLGQFQGGCLGGGATLSTMNKKQGIHRSKKNSIAVDDKKSAQVFSEMINVQNQTDRSNIKGAIKVRKNYESQTINSIDRPDIGAQVQQVMIQTLDGFKNTRNIINEPLKIVNERSMECAKTDGDASPFEVGFMDRSFEKALEDRTLLELGRGSTTVGGILARQSSLDEGIPAKFRNTSYLGLAKTNGFGACDESVPSVIHGNLDKFTLFSRTIEKLRLPPKSRSRDYRCGAAVNNVTGLTYMNSKRNLNIADNTPETDKSAVNSETLMAMFRNIDRMRIKHQMSSSRTHHFPGVQQMSVSDEESIGLLDRGKVRDNDVTLMRVADHVSIIGSESRDSLGMARKTEPTVGVEANRQRQINLAPDVQDLLKKINVINHRPCIRVEGASSSEHVGLSQSAIALKTNFNHGRRQSRQTGSREDRMNDALTAQLRPQMQIEKLNLKSKSNAPANNNFESKNIFTGGMDSNEKPGQKSSEKKKKKQHMPREPILQNQKQQKLLMAHQFAPQPIYLLSTQHAYSKNTMKSFNEAINAINQILQMTLRQKTSQTESQPGISSTHGAPCYFDWNRLQKLAKQCGFPNEFCKKTSQDALQFLRQKDFLTLLRVRMHGLLNSVIYQQFVFTGEGSGATNPPASATLNNQAKQIDMKVPMYAKEKIEKPRIYKATASKFVNRNPFDARVPPNSHLMMLQQWQQSTGGQQNVNSHLQNSAVIAAALQECQAYYQTQQPANYKFYTCSTGNNHPVVRQILKRRTWLTRVDQIKSPAVFDQVQLFWTQWRQQKIVDRLSPYQLYAKIDGNECLSNKANLLATMVAYYKNQHAMANQAAGGNEKQDDTPAIRDAFSILPVTYNVTASKNLAEDREFSELSRRFGHQKAIWICKPGENANRGRGIVVLPNLSQVKQFLQGGGVRWGDKWVVQKYIARPLLIGGKHWNNTPMRKFDLRVFALAQIVDGIHFRGYFYKEGYVRTSSYEYDTSDLTDRDVHLTNDAVQAHTGDYSKYEQGNKVSFKDFANYLQNQKGVDFYKKVLPRIRQGIKHTLDAMWLKLYHTQKRTSPRGEGETGPTPIVNQFELLGYDFMIDEDINVYLIEVNTNPCLDTSPCPLLQRLIPQVLDQTFKLAVDPFLPARDSQYAGAQEMSMSEINYEMVCSNQNEIQAISHKGGAKFPVQQPSPQPLLPATSQKKLEKLRNPSKFAADKSPYRKNASPVTQVVIGGGAGVSTTLSESRRQSKIQKLVDQAHKRAMAAEANDSACRPPSAQQITFDSSNECDEPKREESEEIDETCKKYLKEYMIEEVPKLTSFDDHGLVLSVPSKLL